MATEGLEGPNAGIFAAVGGWLVAIIIAMFTFVAQLRKGSADETAVVLTKWKELVETHERQISLLNDEIRLLKDRVAELEELSDSQKQTIERLHRDLAGERRQSAQRERSFKQQLKRLGHNNEGGILDEDPAK